MNRLFIYVRHYIKGTPWDISLILWDRTMMEKLKVTISQMRKWMVQAGHPRFHRQEDRFVNESQLSSCLVPTLKTCFSLTSQIPAYLLMARRCHSLVFRIVLESGHLQRQFSENIMECPGVQPLAGLATICCLLLHWLDWYDLFLKSGVMWLLCWIHSMLRLCCGESLSHAYLSSARVDPHYFKFLLSPWPMTASLKVPYHLTLVIVFLFCLL